MAETGLDPVFLRIAQRYNLRKRFTVNLLEVGFYLAGLGDNNLLKDPGTLVDKGDREGNRWSGE